ncbi:MAG TPA: hypothetical protein VIC06_15195 [Solirubrobacteraceae bacterium]|jgi:hypothetical protein
MKALWWAVTAAVLAIALTAVVPVFVRAVQDLLMPAAIGVVLFIVVRSTLYLTRR